MTDIRFMRNNVTTDVPEVFGTHGWTWYAGNDLAFEYIKRDWERHHLPLLESLFPNGGGTVVQAGGNCGMYPLLLTQKFKHVYTFEPDPWLFHCLVNNCQLPSIIKLNAGLGAGSGFIDIVGWNPDNCGMRIVGETQANSIPQMALDSFAFKDLDLLFLDIEGYEYNALLGARATLLECKPKIIAEHNDPKEIDRCAALIEPLGYTKITHVGGTDYLYEIPQSS